MKLDLCGAYNLVWKTAFRSPYCHYKYLVMPFSLCNALATFQLYMKNTFWDMLAQFVIIYLDDILIFSKDQALHDQHMQDFWKDYFRIIYLPS